LKAFLQTFWKSGEIEEREDKDESPEDIVKDIDGAARDIWNSEHAVFDRMRALKMLLVAGSSAGSAAQKLGSTRTRTTGSCRG